MTRQCCSSAASPIACAGEKIEAKPRRKARSRPTTRGDHELGGYVTDLDALPARPPRHGPYAGCELGMEYVESVPERPVAPAASLEELRETLDLPLPEDPTDTVTVVEELARDVEPGLTQMGGGRYFGFVIGGSVPAALAADWLTSAWDQNTGFALPTPAAAVVEEVAGRWVKELLALPTQASFAFVTGCQMAHATALLAARHHVLREAGHDVEQDGLIGAPPITVVAGAKRHGTLDRALRFVGLGTSCVHPIAVDDQGRMLIDELRAELARPTG